MSRDDRREDERGLGVAREAEERSAFAAKNDDEALCVTLRPEEKGNGGRRGRPEGGSLPHLCVSGTIVDDERRLTRHVGQLESARSGRQQGGRVLGCSDSRLGIYW